jgi:hypothetical protein
MAMTNDEIDAEFEAAWGHWARKQSKGQARRTYRKWRKSGKMPKVEQLVRVFCNMQNHRRGWLEGFQPHFSTWLNNEGWLDEQDPETKRGGGFP